MGLDMYLSRRTYVKQWNHIPPEEQFLVKVTKGGKETNIQTSRISNVIEEIAYWRKANAIHHWFVLNVQKGVDDCGEYHVTRENLQILLDTCKTILDNSVIIKAKIQNGTRFSNGVETPIIEDGETIQNPEYAESLLPVQNGFFFGSTAYDQYYVADLRYTVEKLTALLEEEWVGHIYYNASW